MFPQRIHIYAHTNTGVILISTIFHTEYRQRSSLDTQPSRQSHFTSIAAPQPRSLLGVKFQGAWIKGIGTSARMWGYGISGAAKVFEDNNCGSELRILFLLHAASKIPVNWLIESNQLRRCCRILASITYIRCNIRPRCNTAQNGSKRIKIRNLSLPSCYNINNHYNQYHSPPRVKTDGEINHPKV